MKKIVAFVLTLALLACMVPATALTASAEELKYEYIIKDGKVTITDCKEDTEGELTIKSKIGGYPVTAIGDSAFKDCDNLETVTLPNTVTTIGKSAFADCDSLLTVELSNKLTSIGNAAFANCDSLISMVIPATVKSIGNKAFLNCKTLVVVSFEGKKTTLGASVFSGCDYLIIGCFYNSTVRKYAEKYDIAYIARDLKAQFIKMFGVWAYYENGEYTMKSGLVKYKGQWFYLQYGIWDNTVTSLIKYKDNWFYIKNGKWANKTNTLHKKNGKYLAVKNGKWYRGKDIISYKGKKFYVNDGFAELDYSGKVKIGDKTYKIKKGRVV